LFALILIHSTLLDNASPLLLVAWLQKRCRRETFKPPEINNNNISQKQFVSCEGYFNTITIKECHQRKLYKP